MPTRPDACPARLAANLQLRFRPNRWCRSVDARGKARDSARGHFVRHAPAGTRRDVEMRALQLEKIAQRRSSTDATQRIRSRCRKADYLNACKRCDYARSGRAPRAPRAQRFQERWSERELSSPGESELGYLAGSRGCTRRLHTPCTEDEGNTTPLFLTASAPRVTRGTRLDLFIRFGSFCQLSVLMSHHDWRRAAAH